MGSKRFLALVARVHSFRRIDDIKPDELGRTVQPQHNMIKCDRSEPATTSGQHNERIFRYFEADLAGRVQQLQLQGGGGSAHLNWLLDACAATLSTHSSLSPLLASSVTPASSTHSRADEMLSLLDLCTSLKHMADDVDRQLSLLQRALYRAGRVLQTPQGGDTTAQSAARRLRACLDGLQFLGSKQYKPLTEAHAAFLLAAKRIQVAPAAAASVNSAALPLHSALDGTLLISLLLLAFTLSSFAAPTSRSSGATRSACKLIARYVTSCSKSTTKEVAPASWVGPLRQLQRDLKQEEMSCVFLELQRLQAAASSLHDALLISAATPADHHIQACGELRHSVDNLRKSSQEAQACITALRSHLASLFQALLALRLALLPTS